LFDGMKGLDRKMPEKITTDIFETIKAVSFVINSHETFDHEQQKKILGLARELGAAMGLGAHETEQLECAVLLHDIGQIKVRETILKKPGKLTREEFIEVQAHPIESEKIISMMPKMEWAAQWSRWHHEWWDGSGYPDQLWGEAIPLPSRILVVVDSFGAMTSDRPYRTAMTKEEALMELNLMAGIQFDPNVVAVFETIINKM
ncbi:MAG TPA: HD domain-containing phosphohydrolase, partial [bacterium]|nr:HD domain-containing phosphohydrolase [bacterium]